MITTRDAAYTVFFTVELKHDGMMAMALMPAQDFDITTDGMYDAASDEAHDKAPKRTQYPDNAMVYWTGAYR